MTQIGSEWTKAVHAGKNHSPSATKPTVAPIYQTSVFSFNSLEEVDDVFSGASEGFIYSRYGNPTVALLEQTLAGLEGAEAALVGASGMAVIVALILSLCSSGDHIIATQDLYGGTQVLFSCEIGRFGIDVSFVDMSSLERVEGAITPATKVIFAESISNPLLKIVDIAGLASLKRAWGLALAIDNTFASPYLCQPLALGADYVIESLTKYINGHSDVTGGLVAGRREEIERVRSLHINLGAVLSPFEAWLVMRGIKTLPLRMRQHCANAAELASYLATLPTVTQVYYPGLPGHPQHLLAKRQMSGYGGMLSFVVHGGSYSVDRVVKNLQIVEFVPSLAGLATTISHPAKTSHRGLSALERIRLGIDDGLIRVSVGIEDPTDIKNDFFTALSRSQ
ncbi:MAG: PLP-dependent aspartate aminotransferase family protein [bacterium]|nr:PLP-dependent aspartate aminotransferase family protein [bacterium]